MKDTLGFETRERRRPPYELAMFRYVSRDGLEIVNAVGAEAERLHDEIRAREGMAAPTFISRYHPLKRSSQSAPQ